MARLKDSDVQYLISLKPEDLTMDLLTDLLADTQDQSTTRGKVVIKPSRFNCTDQFTLPSMAMGNKKPIETTVGKFIFNKYILEGSGILPKVGYRNEEMDNSNLGKLEAEMDRQLRARDITRDEYVAYIDRRDKFSLQMHFALTSSCTIGVLTTPPAVVKRKNELLEQNKEAVKKGDIIEVTKIENELVALAKEELKDDPGMNLYNSGARAKFGNSYKNMNIMKGPVYNAETGGYDVLTSNLMDGLDKKAIPAMGSAIVNGAYPKAVGTQVSGYLAKQILAALQTERLDEKGSDCGSKKTIPVMLYPSSVKDFIDRTIIDNGKEVYLTADNINRYTGKIIHLRSPMACRCVGGKICGKCMGNMFYSLGIENVGVTASKVATTFTNLNMKNFHDSTTKVRKLRPKEMIL